MIESRVKVSFTSKILSQFIFLTFILWLSNKLSRQFEWLTCQRGHCVESRVKVSFTSTMLSQFHFLTFILWLSNKLSDSSDGLLVKEDVVLRAESDRLSDFVDGGLDVQPVDLCGARGRRKHSSQNWTEN